MAITTLDGWVASAKQYISIVKTASRTSVAATWFSFIELAGNPGAGVLAGTNTANGLVPNSATAGCPIINAYGASATGYLSQVDFSCSVACRMKLFDMLFKAGAYAFNAAVTLTAQPSYSARVPGGTDFGDTQIWIEFVTVSNGTQSVAVTYTNQSGVAAKTTGVVVTVVGTVGRMVQLPLAAGDTGVQKIESVTGTVASGGTFNVLVLRPLWSGRVKVANDGDVHGLDKTAMPVIFPNSAIILAMAPDSTSTGVPELEFVISNA